MSIPLQNMETFWELWCKYYAKENIFNHKNKRTFFKDGF